jgi:hypothetical protein
MVKDRQRMQKKLPTRRTILAQSVLPKALVFCFFQIWISAVTARSDQSFAVALPELEGPVTLGIFSEEGALVRLLYRDAPVESITGGLNGLIMTWDEKDDQGHSVPAGNYMAKGLVHGPISISSLPFSETITGPPSLDWPISPTPMPLQKKSIVLRTPKDALLESRPLIIVDATFKENTCTLTAEGLPILSVPMNNDGSSQSARILHGKEKGNARLIIENPHDTTIYETTGLDRIVPLSAGKLEVYPDAFHLSPSAGESTP